jgi:hypothetical protein
MSAAGVGSTIACTAISERPAVGCLADDATSCVGVASAPGVIGWSAAVAARGVRLDGPAEKARFSAV